MTSMGVFFLSRSILSLTFLKRPRSDSPRRSDSTLRVQPFAQTRTDLRIEVVIVRHDEKEKKRKRFRTNGAPLRPPSRYRLDAVAVQIVEQKTFDRKDNESCPCSINAAKCRVILVSLRVKPRTRDRSVTKIRARSVFRPGQNVSNFGR